MTTKTGNDKLQQMTLAETDPSRISTPDLETAEQSLEQRLQIRRHNAITEGRILPKETPSLIGTWKSDCDLPTEGLFELYLDSLAENGKFTGKVEDLFGTASVWGKITKRKITFEKEYIKDESSGNAYHGTLLFKGNLKRKQYEGGWCSKTESKWHGNFQIQLFSISVAENRPYRVAPENHSKYSLSVTHFV